MMDGKESKMRSNVMPSQIIGFVSVVALSIVLPLWASDLTATKTNDTGGTVITPEYVKHCMEEVGKEL